MVMAEVQRLTLTLHLLSGLTEGPVAEAEKCSTDTN